MSKEKTKGFISGVIVMLVIFSLSTTVFAAVNSKSITVGYNNIKVYINEKLAELKDPNGNAVDPFIYNGSTYVPLRSVSEALGQQVRWDAATSSIYIDSQPAKTSSTASNQVLMDQNGIKITYLGTEKNTSSMGGYLIKLKIENTSPMDYMVQVRNFSVNGILCDSIFSSDVEAGKTTTDQIKVYQSALNNIGQTSVSSAKFYFTVVNSKDWSDSFQSDVVKL